MTSTSEVGISPVLLQAITQTLSTSASAADALSHNGSQDDGREEARTVLMPAACEQAVEVESSPHILAGMNQPIAPLSSISGDAVVVVQNEEEVEEDILVVKPEVDTCTYSEQVLIEHSPVPMMSPREDHVVMTSALSSSGGNMSGVLSAIASHLQHNSKKRTASVASLEEPEQIVEVATSTGRTQPILFSMGNHTSVQSPSHDVIVSAGDSIVTSGYETPMSLKSCFKSESPDTKKVVQVVSPDSTQPGDPGMTFVLNSGGTMFEMVHTEQGHIQVAQVQPESSSPYQSYKPCPICGDRVSGYHYGIFSCESCKGFFKRTVQNKKTFICHRKGECVVNIASRKKCPSCRFKRCLLAGMKLEAIRTDRMRGGRSSYDGCSPSIKPKISPSYAQRSKFGTPPQTVGQRKIIQINNPGKDLTTTAIIEDGKAVIIPSGEQYLTVLSTCVEGESSAPESVLDLTSQVQPQTPQALEDLLGVETVVNDEDEEQSCCEGKLREGDTDLFGSMLHLADHCLYKIVRWARNLPDFAEIPTDDQILLLQNSWAELLCLSACWKSIPGTNTLLLGRGRLLDIELAKAMGFADIIQRMLDFTEQLKRLDVDVYEFVALKALILMTPDVNGLKNELFIRSYQEKISEALMIYTATHFVDRTNKFCEMVARLAEISRSCYLAKERLTARQAAGEVPQFSLLSELLKGDIVVQAVESS